jgi:hypothetical protein
MGLMIRVVRGVSWILLGVAGREAERYGDDDYAAAAVRRYRRLGGARRHSGAARVRVGDHLRDRCPAEIHQRLQFLRDPLSGLAWTSQGWLFPLTLALLAIGMLCAATILHRIRQHVGLAPVILLAACGAGGGLAACFPADRAGATVVSAGGEIHRWASLALLVLPTVAALRVSVMVGRTSPGRQGAAYRHRLIALIVATVMCGLVFLGGFLPTLLHTDAPVFSWLAQLNGLAQRVLAMLVMLTAWQLGSLPGLR